MERSEAGPDESVAEPDEPYPDPPTCVRLEAPDVGEVSVGYSSVDSAALSRAGVGGAASAAAEEEPTSDAPIRGGRRVKENRDKE